MSVIRFLFLLFTFFGVLASCAAAVLMVVVLLRFPPLLIAVLLACWIFSRLQNSTDKPSQ